MADIGWCGGSGTLAREIDMDFFNSLTVDMKMLVIGIAGCVVLALFSANPKAERRYVLVLALLAAAGVYRFTHMAGGDHGDTGAAAATVSHVVIAQPKHVPLVSTSAK